MTKKRVQKYTINFNSVRGRCYAGKKLDAEAAKRRSATSSVGVSSGYVVVTSEHSREESMRISGEKSPAAYMRYIKDAKISSMDEKCYSSCKIFGHERKIYIFVQNIRLWTKKSHF